MMIRWWQVRSRSGNRNRRETGDGNRGQTGRFRFSVKMTVANQSSNKVLENVPFVPISDPIKHKETRARRVAGP